MHIKKLTIQGFKTYRDVVAVDPFSEKVNIVVGRNGAGKSNFFSAIRFVLSDSYTSLNRDERQELLHDGSGATATFSAYVEIVFDNSDGRIPTGRNEVILRRTIGAKKDDYSLDRKSTTKTEVMSLLESAGFSKSNPFFIVPQGRITSLTNQKDSERLELLKEIAGTRVYEDRKSESIKIMDETEQKQLKIDELLEFIDERLEELEEEKKELKEFQVADREKRCTEYCIYQRDLEEVKEALDRIDDDRLNEQRQADVMRTASSAREAEISEAERFIEDQKEQLDLVKLEKEQLEAEKHEAIKAKTQVELIIRDLEDTTSRNAAERETLQAELDDLEDSIAAKEAELEAMEPKYQDLLSQEAELKAKIEKAEATQQSLYAKQGRAAQFRTQSERDKYLTAQIQSSTATLEGREKALEEVAEEIENSKQILEDRRKQENELKETLEARRDEAKKYAATLNDLQAKRAALIEQRKECWKEDEKLQQTVQYAAAEVKKAEHVLRSTMDQATQRGLEAVDEIARRLRLDGVYGPLYTLFETRDSFKTAVENIANASLFHVVVDTDETASRILEVMVKEKSGRVTFMPLNRLRPQNVRYPEQAEEAVPMISRLDFDERYRPAMQQVFGKAIIVPDLHIGAVYARSHGLTAITLQGDKQDKKGALTGGFHDSKRSRLDSVKTLKHWQNKYESDHDKQRQTKRTQNQLDQEISKLTGEITVTERRLQQATGAREPLTAEIASLQRDIEQTKNRIQALTQEQSELATHISQLKIEITAQEEELKTPMSGALSDAEAATLTKLANDLQRYKKNLLTLSKDRQALAGKRSSIEIELGQNLRRKRDKIKQKIDSMADVGGGGPTQTDTELVTRRDSLEALDKSIANLNEKIKDVEKRLDQIAQAILKKEKELEALQLKQTEEGRGFAKQQKNVERYLAKRQILLARKDENTKKVRELGALPAEAFEKHKKKLDVKKLYKDLHAANEKLKKFSGVNKRAFDQFNEFTTQREELAGRREELTKSEESIRELIDHLDMRKDEAIERTFKQVSKNFVEVFETLVPTGRGRLIMQRRIDDEDESEEEEVELDQEDEEEPEEDDEDEDAEEDGMDVDEDESDTQAKKKRKKSKAHGKANGKANGKGKSRGKKANGKTKPSSKKAQGKGKNKAGAIEAYTGISIKVSFNSKSDEGLRIQQLSGGQKSLVALALIFSIQKCDPAPFYLFDEIDANLDADRRTAVASMIRSLSDSAQFIITTFRPELLAAADTFFGVMFDNRKISTIQRIARDNAYEFVESASAPGGAALAGR
ncbi:RecF/RecN/SMC protein [Cystobasidium minutum MCA 4210]|uniref:RecF/RecN/SMC protein n=1 Tax=Cystobasidium minutum MCA 4210 TaxID=1397322 RepID=UPI0034CD17DD|eukprot:jgi/Rhomi1/185639/estExt_fgenesh1_pm.C_30272